MKLKNKKTGEIAEVLTDSIAVNVLMNQNDITGYYTSLSELNKEWEDVSEELKGYWFINSSGGVDFIALEDDTAEGIDGSKQIGNYFETEEAELAVRKLKAWKRLKDKGFRFDLLPALGHCDDKKFDISIIGTMPAKWWYNDKVVDDIHYVFGDEE